MKDPEEPLLLWGAGIGSEDQRRPVSNAIDSFKAIIRQIRVKYATRHYYIIFSFEKAQQHVAGINNI